MKNVKTLDFFVLNVMPNKTIKLKDARFLKANDGKVHLMANGFMGYFDFVDGFDGRRVLGFFDSLGFVGVVPRLPTPIRSMINYFY